ncbi:MAG TPA: hypothetical protein VNS32_06315 [Flavisolibacter sp.]|nr:hypothetical protein [Flavisolibacter sp.]
MADDTKNQNPNQSGRADQGSNQSNDQNQQRTSNFDNPQEGSKWDNYQTRTLSSESEESERSGSEQFGDQGRSDSKDR